MKKLSPKLPALMGLWILLLLLLQQVQAFSAPLNSNLPEDETSLQESEAPESYYLQEIYTLSAPHYSPTDFQPSSPASVFSGSRELYSPGSFSGRDYFCYKDKKQVIRKLLFPFHFFW